jgi:hypothetical protein
MPCGLTSHCSEIAVTFGYKLRQLGEDFHLSDQLRSQAHGPHLNISYRGEKGKTTGYYVPQAAEAATREGVAAWQNASLFARTEGDE